MKTNKNDLIKLAESIEALANAIEKDASEAEAERPHVKTAERKAAINYGTVGDGYNENGSSDPITRFALS